MSPPNQDAESRVVLILVADAQVIDRFSGAVRYLQIGLLDESFDTILVVPDHPRVQSIVAGPVAVERYGMSSRFLARWDRRRLVGAVRRRVAGLKRDAPIVVHALSGGAARIAGQLAAELEGQLVITISSVDELFDPQLPSEARQAARVIVPADALRDQMQQVSAFDCPVETVRLGVTATPSPSAFRSSDSTRSLTYVGPLDPASGCDTLIRAAREVLRSHPHLLVFLIGKGPSETQLRLLSRQLEVSDRVIMTGRLENWRQAVDAADLFCLPTGRGGVREEPLQAMADGLIVIAAEDAPYDEMMHDQTALLFPEDDHVALADRIVSVLDDRSRGRRIAATAQSSIREKNSVGHMISEHVRIYRQVATDRRVLRHPEIAASAIGANRAAHGR